MPLPRAVSQRHMRINTTASTPTASAAPAMSASANTSPRAAASPGCASPGSAKSPPSSDYVKARLKTLYMSPKASKIPTLQQSAAKHVLSPIASPAARGRRGVGAGGQASVEAVTRSLSSSPSVSTSTSLHSRSAGDPTAALSHSPLLAPLPSSLTASPVRQSAQLSATSSANLPPISAASSQLPLPLQPGPLLPDHISPRWADTNKIVQHEEHKESAESEVEASRRRSASMPQVHQSAAPNRKASLSRAPPSPAPTQPPNAEPLSVTTLGAASLGSSPDHSSTSSPAPPSDPSSQPLQHSISLPPVLEVERESSNGSTKGGLLSQHVQRASSMPLTPGHSPALQPLDSVPHLSVDPPLSSTAHRARMVKSSSVTRIERAPAGEAGHSTRGEGIPEGEELESRGGSVSAPIQLAIDASSPTAAEELTTIADMRSGRHNSIPGGGDYPLSPSSAAEAFDTLASLNASPAPIEQLTPAQFTPVAQPLPIPQPMRVPNPYVPPHMSGFAPAMAMTPYGLHPGFASLPPPTMPGMLPVPMPGMPYGAHPMDAQYQHFLLLQQHQQQQQQHYAAMAAHLDPPRSHSSAAMYSSSPAQYPRQAMPPAAYSPHPTQLLYSPAPPPPHATYQHRHSLGAAYPAAHAHGQPPPPPLSGTSAGLSDTQARLAFFRDVANNRHADVKEQLERGMQPHCVDRQGNTPLHVACQHGLRRIVKTLLRVGADINAANREGNTPLHMCYGYHYEELGDYLKSKGANDRKLNMYGMSCYDGLKPAEGNAFLSPDTLAGGE